jgi:hypothetical protein
MKPFEITKDIFIVGGPDIMDERDGCVYLINLGELVLIDSGAGWSIDRIIQNIETLEFKARQSVPFFLLTATSIILEVLRKSGGDSDLKSISMSSMLPRWRMETP